MDGPAAVCLDGLGGHRDGHVASQVATHAFRTATNPDLGDPSGRPAVERFDVLRAALLQARDKARRGIGPGNPSMTCAAVVAVLNPVAGSVDVCWAGDCRAYRFDPAAPVRLVQLTYDHDLVYDQWLHGRIDDARAGRVRWALDRAQTSSEAFHLGGPLAKKAFKKRNVMHAELAIGEPSWTSAPAGPGSLILLATDGIHDNLTPDELTAVIDEHHARNAGLKQLPRAVCEAALQLALAGQGRAHHDDMTCVVLRA
ncbi:hypothetical protein DSM112329_02888 [Paraconexibacter sp. AEG42_29]|uniref:PPM-type phosphatase domain-containing protein n=1 Tax=Paraconexibacter sp. AEG42_29 TaxID=2997339 RepID=A0AAU7AXH1_9ACTN